MNHYPEEPWLSTESKLRNILEELKNREPIFHRPEFGIVGWEVPPF